MTRTPEEVFAHHGQALVGGDRDEIVDTFVCRDGMIRAQSVRYTPKPKR